MKAQKTQSWIFKIPLIFPAPIRFFHYRGELTLTAGRSNFTVALSTAEPDSELILSAFKSFESLISDTLIVAYVTNDVEILLCITVNI